MPDRGERQSTVSHSDLRQLAEFAQRTATLTAPERIRTIGTRRNRQRKTLQAVLGTGALAAAALLGTGLANGPGHDHGTTAAGTSASTTASPGGNHETTLPPSPHATFTAWAYGTLPANVTGGHAASLEEALRHSGFSHLTTRLVSSNTVAAGDMVDIVDTNNHSLLGLTVSRDTPLTLVVSTGPAH
jgi:hypothetical protein